MSVTTNNFEVVSPDPVETTDEFEPMGAIDAGPWTSVAYTLLTCSSEVGDSAGTIADQDVKWRVYGANLVDFSDEVPVNNEATVIGPDSSGQGNADSYAVAQAPFRYYRAKVKSASAGNPGTVIVNGIAKA